MGKGLSLELLGVEYWLLDSADIQLLISISLVYTLVALFISALV
jgi:hypothetical protein